MRGKGCGDSKSVHTPGITPAYAGKRTPSMANGFNVRDHPRVCGEKSFKTSTSCGYKGSPPRMRGKGRKAAPSYLDLRITPAYAGKRVLWCVCPSVAGDHPRVCGEKVRAGALVCHKPGSPPRMRGKANGYCKTRGFSGITPAYAGKRAFFFLHNLPFWDHPRVCGEKFKNLHHDVNSLGSPPRMRGKVDFYYFYTPNRRITPAYAGKSRRSSRLPRCLRDHPRVCGEKTVRLLSPCAALGSPPRMRGKASYT